MTRAERESYKVGPRIVGSGFRAERDGVVRFGKNESEAVTLCHKAWHQKIREQRPVKPRAKSA